MLSSFREAKDKLFHGFNLLTDTFRFFSPVVFVFFLFDSIKYISTISKGCNVFF